MVEKDFQDLIVNNPSIQNDICKQLQILDDVNFIKEDTYINGITSDFTILSNKKVVKGIIECKGSDIGITDYVRGIGQIMQYRHFANENMSSKGYSFDANTKIVLCFPSSLLRQAQFNIGLLCYPNDSILMEINEISQAVRIINQKELDSLKSAFNNNLKTICQYYIRDNRLYEIYILLKHLCFLKIKGTNYVNRKELEKNFLIKLKTHNNCNWRNAFISLSSLGLIDTNNLPTDAGNRLGLMEYEIFASYLFTNYIKPYVQEIFNVFTSSGPTNIILNNQEICNKIRENFHGKDVMFLTESDGRYISSWLNILRDDYGCISFKRASSERTIIYNPCKYTEESLALEIKNNSVAYEYIQRYTKLINEGDV